MRPPTHLFRDEGRVDDNHIKRAPQLLWDIVRLGEVIHHKAGVHGPLCVQLWRWAGLGTGVDRLKGVVLKAASLVVTIQCGGDAYRMIKARTCVTKPSFKII